MSQQVLVERFFEALISGDRPAARTIVDECVMADAPPAAIIEKLFWPAYEMVLKLYRQDQLTTISHHYATRLLRMLVDQMQMRLDQAERIDKRVMVLCGPDEQDELAGQMGADMLEAGGYEVFFAGGGVANDEIIAQIGQVEPHVLVLFGSKSSDLPHIRQLIDTLHGMGLCPSMQIVVGGGVFNRADGLAAEIGADLWAKTPCELLETMHAEPKKRMTNDQRTVGRRRRTKAA